MVRDVIGVKIDNCRNEIVTDNDTTNRFPISSIFTKKRTNRLQGQSENKFDSSLLLLFQPITATILGAYFFSETLLIGQLIGVIILLIGIYLAGLSERLRETNEG